MSSGLYKRLSRISLGYGIFGIASIVAVAALVVGAKPGVLTLLASSASSLNGHQAIMYFSPHGEETIPLGATATVDVLVNSRVPINAVGATISVSPDYFDIVAISKEHSVLDLWTEDTTIKETTGEIHFSGGTLKRGGSMDIANILTITIRAKKIGRGELSIKEADIFGADGRGTEVDSGVRKISYTIPDTPQTGVSMSAPQPIVKPSADFNNDGDVSLADVSIMMIQLLAPYNARYDLDMNGSVGISDLSVVFSAM